MSHMPHGGLAAWPWHHRPHTLALTLLRLFLGSSRLLSCCLPQLPHLYAYVNNTSLPIIPLKFTHADYNISCYA